MDPKALSEIRDHSWSIYYELKDTPVSDTLARKHLLASYLDVIPERPSLLHSIMLAEAVKTKKNSPSLFNFRNFFHLWGPDNLRANDWEQFKTEQGFAVSSLVEKVLAIYAMELKTSRERPAPEFVALLEKALERFPGNPHLPYYHAIVLEKNGEKEEAASRYKELVMRTPGKSYLWVNLAHLCEEERAKIGLLCKGVNTGEDGKFVGKARLRLAQALIKRQRWGNALTELEQYRRCYEANGWHLNRYYAKLAQSIPAGTRPEDNSPLYSEYIPFAEEYVYSALPSVQTTKVCQKDVEDRYHPGRKYVLWTLKNDEETLFLKRPHKYGLPSATPNGTIFQVKRHGGKIVWVKPLPSPQNNSLNP